MIITANLTHIDIRAIMSIMATKWQIVRIIMKTMPAGEAKNKFGVLMDTVQREAVAISKKGRTAAIVMPVQEYEEYTFGDVVD
jgi:prevent-host-death family protein